MGEAKKNKGDWIETFTFITFFANIFKVIFRLNFQVFYALTLFFPL